MARGSEEFEAARANYVCLKVTDMRGVDLNRFEFDYGLTLSVLLMHPDGKVYHRYGSRDAHDAMSWMSMVGLVDLLKVTLAEHREYRVDKMLVGKHRPRTVADWPVFRERDKQSRISCVHCHTVDDFRQHQLEADGKWEKRLVWVYPPASRVGFELDPGRQETVTSVAKGSAAAKAGLRTGDRLRRFGRQDRVRTIADVEWALHGVPWEGGEVVVTYERDGKQRTGTLRLADGWREGTPLDLAWRPQKWTLAPAPGFGGPILDDGQKRRRGMRAETWGFRIQYIVNWGRNAHRGRAVQKAGLRKGDVVMSFAGRSDFESMDHFHAWVRLKCEIGQKVEVVFWRDGKRRTASYVLSR